MSSWNKFFFSCNARRYFLHGKSFLSSFKYLKNSSPYLPIFFCRVLIKGRRKYQGMDATESGKSRKQSLGLAYSDNEREGSLDTDLYHHDKINPAKPAHHLEVDYTTVTQEHTSQHQPLGEAEGVGRDWLTERTYTPPTHIPRNYVIPCLYKTILFLSKLCLYTHVICPRNVHFLPIICTHRQASQTCMAPA